MPRFDVALVNQAAYPQEEIGAFLRAMQTYLVWIGDFWTEAAGSTIREVTHGDPMTGMAQLVLAFNTTMAGSLGYHINGTDTLPTGIVEKEACDEFNWPWTGAATHELAEMLIDPTTTRYAPLLSDGHYYPVEIADPVTAERGHMISGVEVSNFTTPAFWGIGPGSTRYDMYGTVRAPLPTIPHLGWVEWYDGAAWQNAWGVEPDPKVLEYHMKHVGRRYFIRTTVPREFSLP